MSRRAFARPGLLLASAAALGGALLLLLTGPGHTPQAALTPQPLPAISGDPFPIPTDPRFTQVLPITDLRVQFKPTWVYSKGAVRGRSWTLADLRPGVHLDGVSLPGVRWPAIRLSRVQLWSFDFSGATLAGARFTHSQLRFCNFNGADLSHLVLSHSYLVDSELRGANLVGADLRTATLLSADLTGAIYDRHTRWPAGFRPEELRARLVE